MGNTRSRAKAVLLTALAAAAAITALSVAGPAAAADEPIVGQGSVVLDFTTTPGSVDVQIWTQNLSTVEAWGRALIQDVDGTVYPFGPRHYAPGEEWTFSESLPGYTCADLGNATGVAFGFATEELAAPDWTSGQITYPDPRITVIGCDSPAPTGGDPVEEPVVTPADSGTTTTPAAGNVLPASNTDGALWATPTTTAMSLGALSGLAAVAAGLGALVILAASGRLTARRR